MYVSVPLHDLHTPDMHATQSMPLAVEWAYLGSRLCASLWRLGHTIGSCSALPIDAPHLSMLWTAHCWRNHRH